MIFREGEEVVLVWSLDQEIDGLTRKQEGRLSAEANKHTHCTHTNSNFHKHARTCTTGCTIVLSSQQAPMTLLQQ